MDLGFSIADAERPSLQLDGQKLTIRFSDWRDQPVGVTFDDTIGVRWQEAEYFYSSDERFDSAHLIEHSAWLREHERQAMAWADSGHRHLKLNFNAAGILEVLCTNVHVLLGAFDETNRD